MPGESGKVVASVSSSNQLALSAAPFCVALAFEATHGYVVPFIGLALLQIVGMIIIAWSWTSRPDRLEPAS